MQALFLDEGTNRPRAVELHLTCLTCKKALVLVESDESGDALGIYTCPNCRLRVDAYVE
jgi:DNA-directed RNA polymerase subunit RPC12/RpoP